ncbi:hypothetical protein [Streptomyces diastatochromogenes]|uniref:hypothetical protein n=1 Tax=Streptomyces diastatochromogenes TaxID=42236 RepID=UPI00142D6213|nr:hypothetical protein [Streptomyces diastatochromogenes]MCZ0985791.1 hypothetical protein [Streptomyces diastatochromogenes]
MRLSRVLAGLTLVPLPAGCLASGGDAMPPVLAALLVVGVLGLAAAACAIVRGQSARS